MNYLSKLPSAISQLKMTYAILFFYLIVILLTTTIGYMIKNKQGVNYGIGVGLIVSILLWVNYGQKMAY